MKLFLKVVLSIVIVFAIVIGGGFLYITGGLKSGAKMVINDINPSALSDGTYIGEYSGGRWTNELKVTIKDKKITDIEIIKDVKISKPEVIEELFGKVIQNQSTKVDTVSGATVSSKAYLKSIENALNK